MHTLYKPCPIISLQQAVTGKGRILQEQLCWTTYSATDNSFPIFSTELPSGETKTSFPLSPTTNTFDPTRLTILSKHSWREDLQSLTQDLKSNAIKDLLKRITWSPPMLCQLRSPPSFRKQFSPQPRSHPPSRGHPQLHRGSKSESSPGKIRPVLVTYVNQNIAKVFLTHDTVLGLKIFPKAIFAADRSSISNEN